MITFKDVQVTVKNVNTDYVEISLGCDSHRIENDTIRELMKGENINQLQYLLIEIAKRLSAENVSMSNLTAVKQSIESAPFNIPR